MATISSTLKLADAFTGPLRKITQGLNLTLSAMENLQGAAERDTKIAKQFDAARKMISGADAELRKMAEDIDKANKNQQRLNNSVKDTNTSMMKLAKSAAGVVAAYIGVREVKNFMGDLFQRGIDFNAFRQSADIAFTTFLGDAKLAQKYMDDMLTFARTTPFAYPDLLTAGRNMIAFGMEAEKTFPVVKAIGDATAAIGGNSQKLTEIADIFGAIQVSGQLSMQEVNRLHTNGIQALEMLAEQFNVTGSEMKKMISQGAIGADAAIAILVDGIDSRFSGMMEKLKGTWAGTMDSFSSARRNAGAEMMQMYMTPLMGLVGSVTDFFKRLPTLIGPGVNAFLPLIAILTTTFETGKIDSFFTVFNVGLQISSLLITGLVQSVLWLWSVITTGSEIAFTVIYNLGAILMGLSPIIFGVIAAIATYNAVLALNNSILFVTGTLIPMIRGLMAGWSIVTLQLAGAMSLAVIKQKLLNLVMRMNPIGIVISLITALITALLTFQVVTNGIKKVFSDAFGFVVDIAEKAVNFIIETINKALRAINSVSSFFANLLGVEAKQIQELEVSADFSGFKKAGQDFIENFSLEDLKSKFSVAYETPESPDMPFDPTGFGAFNQGFPTEIDKVGEVGRIRDSVDISSEDLKMMRELAEMRNIQNFVTLQPQMTFGDTNIRQDGRSIDEIVANINNKLTEELAISAEGLFNV